METSRRNAIELSQGESVPAAAEHPASILTRLDAALHADQPLNEQLDVVAREIGELLAASRVMIYGNSEWDDPSVRIRTSWRSPDYAPLGAQVTAIPLLTHRPRHGTVVTNAPRGVHCPSDCETTHPDCALRGACASVMVPLEIAGDTYGTIAVHARTGHRWTDHERRTVQHAAERIALQIARHRAGRLRDELTLERVGIATTVLHQVATPITILRSAIEQLAAHQSADVFGGHDFIGLARDECRRLQRLCDDLAAIVATTSHDEHDQTCDVVEQLAASARDARHRHPDAMIAITVVGEIAPARCAAAALGRVLRRLIDNAIRYNPAPPHIDITTWSERHNVVIRVRDNGPGISTTDAERLAEPFTRLDPDMRSHPGGAGLSLAIANRIAHEAHGDLQIEPRTDTSGTQVTITLPAAW